MRILAVLSSLITISMGIPVEHDLIDLSQVDLVGLANLLFTPHVDTSDHLTDALTGALHHIKETSHGVTDKLKSGSVHASHLIGSKKEVEIGAALLPIEVAVKSAAVGGAITAAAAVKGSLVGSAIATPIILKAVALPGLAAGKTAAILAVPALLTHKLETKVQNSTHRLISNGKNALKKGAKGVVSTVGLLKKGALGLAAKGALVMKKGAVVAGKLILKPIAIIAGSQLKIIGTGLTIGGKVVGATGAGVKKAGTAVKYAGLGAVGLGATSIGWGLDKTTIDNHFEDIHKKHRV